jgi:hypothetical protein
MKSGSASIDRHEDTQAPHWMQLTDCVTSSIDSGGTTYSRSGGSPAGSSHGVTRAAHDQRAVLAVADLEQAVEDREVGIEVDLELLPVRALGRLRLVAANLERVLRHLSAHYPSQ